ncbi:hypothetical protein [Ktedonobacter robiniae]|uniref:Uncharacterized protein n=1 Tax=Ktedonobacter robiniae TaxID=2778365 RepID=A0ABQ3V6X5_9CHLR|nr:hypothetical protein [Ktedonobacter robiniae]GHO60527.1 hypothetical protein KSB_90020 [Ktedonobacter robiniae]
MSIFALDDNLTGLYRLHPSFRNTLLFSLLSAGIIAGFVVLLIYDLHVGLYLELRYGLSDGPSLGLSGGTRQPHLFISSFVAYGC